MQFIFRLGKETDQAITKTTAIILTIGTLEKQKKCASIYLDKILT